MRYTKGNWYVSGNKVGPRIVSDDQDDGMMMPVCYIETFDYPDQHEANAKLIASAPALLDALLLIKDKVWIHVEMNMFDEEIAQIEAAIKQARGEQ